MLFYTVVQNSGFLENLYLFDTLTDQCLLCVGYGSDLFPELDGAVRGDRFRILVSPVEMADSVHVQAFEKRDYFAWVKGKDYNITPGAANELRNYRARTGATEVWVRVSKLEEVA